MFEYRIYTPAECPEELYSFRYGIYVEEMHRKQRYACHRTKTIRDPLDDTARQVVAHKDGRIVACIRANLLKEGPVGDYFDFYELDRLLNPDALSRASICTRLMVSPKYRRTHVSVDIFKHLYVFGLAHEIDTSFMDCNRHLTGFFQKFGYEFLFRKHHEEYGDVAVMSLNLRDYQRLIDIDSPFAETARTQLEISKRSLTLAAACSLA
ncbi:N-acyl amino acid synthase FeeM domain-containing protein [Amphiplicatus metriothermophilus]|uniref:Acetyltransferase (GNAT) domain-containing protein n=1 Tax=Amphiplicatus metriothermophilus TaxID=1519374 RepID=A0A239PLI2_9PROT|nr:GNAT family N-acyltransferase [Amphiplicatus metriothermophilus]MBB5517472.1 putative GNAT family N-acyltransferase [Amphiplicatus metriothermophilus]SNT68193.1 Acetyltransferase (GNAT) domain-containing protein [Amphiplicatus metriothermophilus]